ncbi:MAG: hypothetical protein ATN35_00470 [Epulopiscium sp. Nele67-Bin004]|nr:MAG: hypothetical protein ATN35_00470 [Epulopiscium sp. Nele67-Bin004]
MIRQYANNEQLLVTLDLLNDDTTTLKLEENILVISNDKHTISHKLINPVGATDEELKQIAIFRQLVSTQKEFFAQFHEMTSTMMYIGQSVRVLQQSMTNTPDENITDLASSINNFYSLIIKAVIDIIVPLLQHEQVSGKQTEQIISKFVSNLEVLLNQNLQLIVIQEGQPKEDKIKAILENPLVSTITEFLMQLIPMMLMAKTPEEIAKQEQLIIEYFMKFCTILNEIINTNNPEQIEITDATIKVIENLPPIG